MQTINRQFTESFMHSVFNGHIIIIIIKVTLERPNNIFQLLYLIPLCVLCEGIKQQVSGFIINYREINYREL